MNEPKYISADPFEEDYPVNAYKRWSKPTTYLETMILRSVGRQRYKSESEGRALRKITKATYDSEGVPIPDSLYPLEWVKHCCEVAIKMRESGKMIQLNGLMTLLNNKERKQEFLESKQTKTKNQKILVVGGADND
ncbi:hypothetical protein MUP59_06360 [Candidatus Bathyarchaeota archaeon]|nr:hypothetical protein [Candidatus Bathyarchaeota archaeon]